MSNIPFSAVIWDAKACAEYLGEEKSTFLKRTQHKDGFPQRCPKPGQPRWRAIEVAEWATGQIYEQATNEAEVS